MIKTPVKRHEMFTSSFVDKFGCFLDDAQMNDAQKSINMHDELVSMLKDIALVDGGSECIKSKIARARELLEKCK